MGKNNKKNLDELKRNDPSENNREISENEEGRMKNEEMPVSGCQIDGKALEVYAAAPDHAGIRFESVKSIAKIEEYAGGESLLGLSVALLEILKQKVDPEISANNPVWHWALCDDHCTFIFRDGRKVRVEL